jgi:hypothetical protein
MSRPMPDRAAVDAQFTATGLSAELQRTPRGWSMDFQDQQTGEWWVAIRKADFEEMQKGLERQSVDSAEEPAQEGLETDPEARALVALSPDRRWLVVVFPNVHKLRDMWAVLKCTWAGDFFLQDHIPDTGQSADEVLDAWLEGKDHA